MVIFKDRSWIIQYDTLKQCNISAKSASQVLFEVISRISIPKELMTKQGTSFLSCILKKLYALLSIKYVLPNAYHSETGGMVEGLNKTLIKAHNF